MRGLNLRVERGEFVAVKGESGSGKTTLLEILAGVRHADGGRALVDGEELSALSDKALARVRRSKLGVVYQQFGLISTLTAEENISLPLSLEGVKKEQIKARVLAVAKRLKIDGALNKFPSELSGGQQQRVALARATVYFPQVLLLDEPTGSLDRANAENVIDYLRELNENGVTVLMITHSGRAVERAGRVVTMSDGVIAP